MLVVVGCGVVIEGSAQRSQQFSREDARASTMDNQPEAENLKLVLLGDVAVGKSSLSHRFVCDAFLVNSESTVRIAFQSKNLSFEDAAGNEVNLNLRIWDTAGQEKYRSLAPLYIRGADVAIIVYDVTSRESAEAVGYWQEELRQSGEDLVVAIAGNKVDVAGAREVPAETGQVMASAQGAIFQETSAQSGDGVEALFVAAAKAGWEKKKSKDARKMAGVSLNGDGHQESQGKCAC